MIRKFEKNDINLVMEIWKNENIKAHHFIPKEYWENNYNYVKDILPNSEIYVYILKEKIVGFIGLNNNHIEGIFVDTNSQCNGIGSALLNKAKKNINAIDFYIKNGFTIVGENLDKNTNEMEYSMCWNK